MYTTKLGHAAPVQTNSPLTDNQALVGREVVLRYLEVKRRRALPYTPRNIVVRTVAGAKPAAVIAGFANRHAAQVCADAQHDEPFGPLDTVGIGLRVTERLDAVGNG